MLSFPVTTIIATDIADAWFQCLYNILDVGFTYEIDRGSFVGERRVEFDYITVFILDAYKEPYYSMMPQIPPALGIPSPVADGYIEQYLPYLLTDVVSPEEQYTYGQRIHTQIEYWIEALKKTPNTNQAVLQVAENINDHNLSDPPCLRHIDMRVKHGNLIFYPYFRSWDLWSGFPANLGAIAVLQKQMADAIGLELGPICASSKGLHYYGYVDKLVKLRCGVSEKNNG